jgi:hypothetical protein
VLQVDGYTRGETPRGTVVEGYLDTISLEDLQRIQAGEPFTFRVPHENDGKHEHRRISRSVMRPTELDLNHHRGIFRIWCELDLDYMPVIKHRLRADPFSSPIE